MGETVNGEIRTSSSSGTCLHIAHSGERCTRPARFGVFCERHDPQATPRPMMPLVRMAAAVFLLMVFLWPLVADLVREIARWIR